MVRFLVFILWFITADHNPVVIKPKVSNENYRAARYSMWIDFTKAQQIVPEMQYVIPGLTTLSYKYFIQYGRDTLIELIDPGNDIKAFTGCIRILDYANRKSTFTCFIDQSKTYYTTKDSITYSIDERRGNVTDLGKGVELISKCDTVKYTLLIPETNYTVIFNDTIANLRSKGLFYPDRFGFARCICSVHHGLFLETHQLSWRIVCNCWWFFNGIGHAQQPSNTGYWN